MGLFIRRLRLSRGWPSLVLAFAGIACQGAPAAPPAPPALVRPAEVRPAAHKVVVVGGEPRPAVPTPAVATAAQAGRSTGQTVQTRPGDLAARALAVSTTPTTGKGTSGRAPKTTTPVGSRTPGPAARPSATVSATASPTNDAEATEGPYPTPTFRPAHPPPRGPVIIPRPQQPVIRDRAVNAAGVLRPDSVTPVPFVRYPAPPPDEELPEESAP